MWRPSTLVSTAYNGFSLTVCTPRAWGRILPCPRQEEVSSWGGSSGDAWSTCLLWSRSLCAEGEKTSGLGVLMPIVHLGSAVLTGCFGLVLWFLWWMARSWSARLCAYGLVASRPDMPGVSGLRGWDGWECHVPDHLKIGPFCCTGPFQTQTFVGLEHITHRHTFTLTVAQTISIADIY